MNVLHITSADLPGRRFNGYDLISDLHERGIGCKQLVLEKMSDSPDVVSVLEGTPDERLAAVVMDTEWHHGLNDVLTPWGRAIAEMPEFLEADVVHHHLIHCNVISLLDLPAIFRSKPAVWTFHDPWPFTGHCIYPRECTAWLDGCQVCPHLGRPFPMKTDCARHMWSLKKQVYAQLDADIIVASPFMRDLVARSPLTAHFDRVHEVPFGIQADAYLPDAERQASREKLGIPLDDFVILFRSTTSEFKGLEYILQALRHGRPARSTTLLTLDMPGLLGDLSEEYNIVELGWVEDESVFPSVFCACDVFLMPSTAEAFGLMALESMAASRPVICFEGTSLPGVTHAPECGIAVPMGDSVALRAAIDRLMGNPEEADRRGRLGRELACTEYSHDTYVETLVGLYERAAERRRG